MMKLLLFLTVLEIVSSFVDPNGVTVLGSVDAGQMESSIFYFKDTLYFLDNIGCGYIDKNNDGEFEDKSYARIREFYSGKLIANVTETAGTSFIAPFVDAKTDTLWLHALNVDRCQAQCGKGMVAISTIDMVTWESNPITELSDLDTCNNGIASVPDGDKKNGLPPHKYIMHLETFVYYLNNNEDGNLSYGWFPAPNTTTAPDINGGGVTVEYEDGYYYIISGGDEVFAGRSKDLGVTDKWETATLISPTMNDTIIANFLDFPNNAERKGFTADCIGHPERWDFNSNDGDFCCSNAGVGAWAVWGASTQGGGTVEPCEMGATNAVKHAPNMTLAELLGSYF